MKWSEVTFCWFVGIFLFNRWHFFPLECLIPYGIGKIGEGRWLMSVITCKSYVIDSVHRSISRCVNLYSMYGRCAMCKNTRTHISYRYIEYMDGWMDGGMDENRLNHIVHYNINLTRTREHVRMNEWMHEGLSEWVWSDIATKCN